MTTALTKLEILKGELKFSPTAVAIIKDVEAELAGLCDEVEYQNERWAHERKLHAQTREERDKWKQDAESCVACEAQDEAARLREALEYIAQGKSTGDGAAMTARNALKETTETDLDRQLRETDVDDNHAEDLKETT